MATTTRSATQPERPSRRRGRSSRPAGPAGSEPGTPAAELASRSGLRVRPYRPMRALVGALLVVASVVAALAIYARVGNRSEVLAVNRDVLAGEQITDADLQVVSISSDDSFPSVAAADRALVVGQFARVRLASGSLLVSDSVQADQLVDPDLVLMSVEVPVGQVPVGLREQSRLALVVTPPQSGGDDNAPVLVEAIVAAVPRNLAEVVGNDDSGRSLVALSVEVGPKWVTVVGSAAAVSVGVLDPDAPFPPDPPSPASPAGDDTNLYGATTLPGASTNTPAAASDEATPTAASDEATATAAPTTVAGGNPPAVAPTPSGPTEAGG